MNVEWFHLVAERLTTPVLLLAMDGECVASNAAAARILDQDCVGKKLSAHVEDPAALSRTLTLASRSAKPLPGAFTLRHRSERWRFGASSVKVEQERRLVLELRGANDAVGRFLALNQQLEKLQLEIRRRSELEQERLLLLENERAARADAEAANRLKDEFLASVSHELRTPLHAISGWVQVLRERSQDAALQRQGLDVIDRNVKVQTQLTEDLMDTALIITGRLKLELASVELEHLVHQAVDVVRPVTDAKQQRLEIIANVGSGRVNADGNRLLQVFGNLLSNASRYTPVGGKIQVVVRRVNSHVEVAVSDTGEGIAPELLPYIFDRFRRHDGSTTRRHGGLGLGLAIVRHLVELHGGVVMVDSPGVGKGATFTISLPMPLFRTPAAATQQVAPQELHQQPLSGLKVLLVEDHDDSRELLEAILMAQGASVVAVAKSSLAQQSFRADAPDFVISDIEMPEEDGFTMMRKLRDIERELQRRPIPAIAVSAHSLGDARLHALRAGYQSFLVKPMRANELVATVQSLRHHKPTDA